MAATAELVVPRSMPTTCKEDIVLRFAKQMDLALKPALAHSAPCLYLTSLGTAST